MKKILVLIIFFSITFNIFSDKFIKTTLDDYNLKGKFKTYKIIHKYKYGLLDNPVSKKTYEMIGKKIEKFGDEEEYEYY